MPILRRIWTGSTPGAYTSAPSTRTVPVTRAPGTTSCIRFRHRMNVDLPQPDGPMSAVTAFGAIEMPISCSTWCSPNHALRSLTRMPSAMSPYPREAAACRDARRQTYHKHQADENERAGPRLAMPVVVRRDCIREDLQGQRRDRLIEPLVPEAVAEGREEQRRRLSGYPRDGDHRAGDDAGARGRQYDAQQHLPFRDAERQRRLAQRGGHQP